MLVPIHALPPSTTSFVPVEEFEVLFGNLIKEGRVSLVQNERFTSHTGHFRDLVCQVASETGGWGQGGADIVEGTLAVPPK